MAINFDVTPTWVHPVREEYNVHSSPSRTMKRDYYLFSTTPILQYRLEFRGVSDGAYRAIQQHWRDVSGTFSLFNWRSVPSYIDAISYPDLLSGWDFTSGWTASDVTIDDADSFTVDISNGYIYQAPIVAGKLYSMRIAGTAAGTITNFRVEASDTTRYKESMTGTFDETFTFIAKDAYIVLRGTGTGQIDITTLTLTQKSIDGRWYQKPEVKANSKSWDVNMFFEKDIPY